MSPTLVLVYAEGDADNDRRVVEHLVHALKPDGIEIRVERRRSPLILSRGAAPKKRAGMAREISVFVREARRATERCIAVAFRDCDACEPAHIANAEELETELRTAGVQHPVAAAPAWELEAWLALFPSELQATRTCWRAINWGSRNVGMIENVKEELTRALSSGTNIQRCKPYRESDSVRVSSLVRENHSATDTVTSRSASLARFRDRLRAEFVRPLSSGTGMAARPAL